MFRLKTLGGALLEGPDGPWTGAAAQRRRLAVLSLLAASGHGISRDRLVALLWPESDETHARHALAQLLYGLRRELGNQAVTGSATALRLDPAVVSSDVHEFRQAIAAKDYARAAELYAGPFLDGFHLPGSAEFERWLDETRAVLAERARAALENLARTAEAAGDLVSAVAYWRRVVSFDCLDPRSAIALMRSLAGAGDAAGAVRHARIYERLVREELGSDPDAAVLALAATLADSHAPAEASGGQVIPATMAIGASSSEPPPRATPSRSTLLPKPPDTTAGGVRPVRRLWRAAALAVAFTAPVFGFLVWRADRASSFSGFRESIVIAGPANATGDPIFDATVPLALAVGLSQSPRLTVVTPERLRQTLVRMRQPVADTLLDETLAREIARRDGVRFVLVPAVHKIQDDYEITARVIIAESGAVHALAAIRVAHQDDVVEALDGLARRLRRQLGEPRTGLLPRADPPPRVTTRSLEALAKYASGSRAFNGGRWAEAAKLWSDAVAIDSTFATAHAALGMHAYWTNRATEGESHFARALGHLDGLPDREQTMVRARIESWRGNRDSSIAILRAFLIEHSDDIEALRRLGYDYLRTNRNEEAATIYRRLVALDSLDHNALINLATVERELGDYGSALRHYRQAFALVPEMEAENSNLNHEFGGTYVLAGALDSAASVFSRMLTPDRNVRARGLRSHAFLAMFRGRYTEASAHLAEAIRLTRMQQAQTSEVRNRLLMAGALAQRGLIDGATEQLDSAYALVGRVDADPVLLFWLGKALVRAGDVRRAELLAEALDAKRHPDNRSARAASEALHAEVLVGRGRPADALFHLETALQLDSTKVTLESLSRAVAETGDLGRAARLYKELAEAPAFGWEGQEPWRLAQYWQAEIAERQGNVDKALQFYEQFLEAWQEAELSLPILREARDRLVRLRHQIEQNAR